MSVEELVFSLKDAVELAKAWRERYLSLEKAARRALKALERNEVPAAREILLQALKARGGKL